MDLRDRVARFSVFKDFHARLQALQKRSAAAKPDPQKLKTFRGLTLVFISILFGWTSLQATESSSIAKFRMKTWPNEPVWKSTLLSEGFGPRLNIGEYSRQIQGHPDAFSSDPMIWVSDDGCIIYLSASPYRERSSELWTCELNPKTPTHWSKAGTGIDGFEKLVDFLQKNPKKTLLSQKPRMNSVDPKEIRY